MLHRSSWACCRSWREAPYWELSESFPGSTHGTPLRNPLVSPVGNIIGWNIIGWNIIGWNITGWNIIGWNTIGWNIVGQKVKGAHRGQGEARKVETLLWNFWRRGGGGGGRFRQTCMKLLVLQTLLTPNGSLVRPRWSKCFARYHNTWIPISFSFSF